MPDMTLTCRDCGQPFTFTEGEQDFYAGKGYSQPTRCASCRATKKAQRQSSDYGDSYGNDSGGGGGYSSGGGGGYSSGGGGGYGGGRSERTMTQVTCSSCGKAAEVPFVPSGDRPVYCSDCFSQQGGGGARGGGGGRSGGRY